MSRNPFRTARYLLSAYTLDQLPPDRGREAAFVGRSNAGKSSVLNALADQRALAHVSRTPGRTRQINLYSAGEHARLADLPGYGYARVPAAMQKHWQETLAPYLEQRHSLCQLIVVLDCRRGLTDLDLRMLDLAWSLGRPCHVLLNKADKLAAAAARAMLAEVAARTAESGAACQLFSAVDRQGTDELRRVLRRALFD